MATPAGGYDLTLDSTTYTNVLASDESVNILTLSQESFNRFFTDARRRGLLAQVGACVSVCARV